MNPQLRLIAEKIIQQHPNLMRMLLHDVNKHLPLGIGEGKVKSALAENIPEWMFSLSESDLKDFVETLQRDPEFYRYLKFQLTVLEKILCEK